MKKLLLLAVAAFTVTANAQTIAQSEMQKVKMPKVTAAQQQYIATEQAMAKAPKRLFADDCWYTRPVGSMSRGFDIEGYGYYAARLAVTPYVPFTLNNMCSMPKAAKWFWGEEDVTADFADANNNFEIYVDGGSGYYMPSISNGKSSYAWGENNYYNSRAQGDNRGAMMSFSDVEPLRFTDPHLEDTNDPSNLNGHDLIGWGFLDSHYLFGDGMIEYTLKDEEAPRNFQSFAVMQVFEKPMSPLYVENIFVSVPALKKPIPLLSNDVLTLEITDLDGNNLYTLTCTSKEIIRDTEPQTTDYGSLFSHTAVFTLKEVDPLSGEMASVPFVIDQEFIAILTGFEGKGLGFAGHICTDEEDAEIGMAIGEDNVRAGVVMYDVDDPEKVISLTYQSPICLPLVFNAMFDNVMVWESAQLSDGTVLDDFNVLKVSEDGETVQNAGYPEANFIFANTAASWFDEEENDQYYLADIDIDVPEWILGYGVDNSGWEDEENIDPKVAVGIVCDPLPAGVSGRGAKLYVYGRGVVSEEPIYVLQGDFTKAQCDAQEGTGIEAITINKEVKSAMTVNLMGQRVNNDYKGIVVRNGEKMIQK